MIKDILKDWWEDNKMVFIIVVGFIISFLIAIATNLNDHTYIATITDKERDNANDDNRYLIYAELEDGSTLVMENTDSFIRLKFNSSDLYGDLKVGETYKFRVVGYRYPFLSMYENIISYELVEEKDISEIDTKISEDNSSYIVTDLNEKIRQGFSVIIIVDGNEITASDTFVFTEKILSEYNTMVDYDNKTIVLTNKS